MNLQNKLIGGFLFSVIAYSYIRAEMRNVKNIGVTIRSVKPDFEEAASYLFTKLPLLISLEIDNPTVFTAKILSIDLTITVNNIKIAEIKKNETFEVQGKRKTIVNFISIVNVAEIGFKYNQLLSLLDSAKIQVTGFANTQYGTVKINKLLAV
jgi:LEA14-like dessication related protein